MLSNAGPWAAFNRCRPGLRAQSARSTLKNVGTLLIECIYLGNRNRDVKGIIRLNGLARELPIAERNGSGSTPGF